MIIASNSSEREADNWTLQHYKEVDLDRSVEYAVRGINGHYGRYLYLSDHKANYAR